MAAIFNYAVHYYDLKDNPCRTTLKERCSNTTSTIFCTQYRKDDWIKRLGEGIQAEAIVDRYAHTAYWIETGSITCGNTVQEIKIAE